MTHIIINKVKSKSHFFALFFILVIPNSLLAQNLIFQKSKWYAELNYHYGFLAPHHKYITYYLQEHIKGFEVNVGYKTNGARKWQQIYDYPFLGVGYYHSGLSNNKVFGKMNALFLYLKSDKQLFRDKVSIYNKTSFGISHLSEKFDLQENHYNISIGSHFNAFLQGSVGIRYQLQPKVQLSAGLSFTHTSNGHLKSPNQGLNFITTSLGFNYDLNSSNSDFQYETKKKEIDYRFTVISSVGVKQVSHRINGNFLTSSLVFDVDLLRSQKRRYGFGFDFFYDESTKKQHEFDNIVFSESDKYYRIAGHLSYVTVVGKTSFVIQPGIYLWNHYEVYGRVSNRFGIRYRFSEHFLFNISVKAHWVAIADYLEWGIGYAW